MDTPELVVMLTHNDRTVENAYQLFETCKDTKAKYWGFKEEPLPPEQMKELYAYMKACGKITSLEVVAYTEEECLAEGIGFDESQSSHKFYVEDKRTGARCSFPTGREAFAFFISQTEKNIRNVWQKNPPVYVYTFETID